MAFVLMLWVALFSCQPALAQSPDPDWNWEEIQRLEHWVRAAPEDALPVLDMSALRAAQAAGDEVAIDREATALALRLARMHLLGCATPAQRAGWHIADSDTDVDLTVRLAHAVAVNSIDSFFEGLRPRHPDYGALRAAYAVETDPERRITIARNMERWRWMPQSLGEDYLLVNVARFEVVYWKDGQSAGTWRVIAGKTSTPSPVFSAKVTGVIYNPWWYVPASIVREMHGRFPASRGYVRTANGYAQKPGPGNALGQVKLDMPNPFTVYLHDTPSKQLFEKEVRAFSHGCIRVGDALDFAVTLLDGAVTQAERDAILAGRKTTRIALARPLPIYVAYFTASADGDGGLTIHPDIYGRDKRLGDPTDPGRGCSS